MKSFCCASPAAHPCEILLDCNRNSPPIRCEFLCATLKKKQKKKRKNTTFRSGVLVQVRGPARSRCQPGVLFIFMFRLDSRPTSEKTENVRAIAQRDDQRKQKAPPWFTMMMCPGTRAHLHRRTRHYTTKPNGRSCKMSCPQGPPHIPIPGCGSFTYLGTRNSDSASWTAGMHSLFWILNWTLWSLPTWI